MEAVAEVEKIRRMTPVSAPEAQQTSVKALARALETLGHLQPAPRCELVGPKGTRIAIPESVFYVLARVVEVLAHGDAVTIVPVGKMLTTQQAADLLNVSRQYLVRLLEQQQIPFTKTGKHRRLRIDDVVAFKEQRDASRRAALDELAHLSEDYGGYEELK